MDSGDDWRERLAAEIHGKGVKLTHLSTSLGFHRDYVSNVLTGKAKPSTEKLRAICDGVGTSFSYILTGARQNGEQEALLRDLAGLPEDSLKALRNMIRSGAFDQM